RGGARRSGARHARTSTASIAPRMVAIVVMSASMKHPMRGACRRRGRWQRRPRCFHLVRKRRCGQNCQPPAILRRVTRSIAILGRRGRDLDDLAAALSARADSRCEIVWVPGADALLERLRGSDPPALVVVDYAHGDGRVDAGTVLDRIRTFDRELPVVVVAAHADVDLVAEAVRAGATDFLVRGERLPDRVATLLGKLDRLLRLRERA